MISAIIVLTLLSLLVATDPEPASSPVHPTPEPPLRPHRKSSNANEPESDRLAA